MDNSISNKTGDMPEIDSARKLALKISGLYMMAGALWIFCSDFLIASAFTHLERYATMGILKGLAFIILTTLILYKIIRRYLSRTDLIHDRLRENQTSLTKLLSNLPGTVYRCQNNQDWTMTFISERCEKLTGYTAEQFLEEDIEFGDLIHPDDREFVWKSIQESLHDDEPFELEYRLIDRQNNERWVYERGQGIEVNGGERVLEGFIEDITDVKKTEQAAERARNAAVYQARHDVLTGLPNRRWFLQQVEDLIENYDSDEEPEYAFCIVDLHNFKQINDFYGHWVGNKLLSQCGQWLETAIPDEDLIGRLGGDEFGLFIKLDTNKACRDYLLNLLGDLQNTFEIEDVSITQRINVGIARYPDHGDSMENMITSANLALNRSKEINNRDIAIFKETDRETIEKRVTAGEEILEALNNYRLRIYYQPVVDVRDQTIMMQEALLRILSPDGDLMTLGSFKEILNDGRITSRLDRWIVRRILDETIDYIGSDIMPMISINLFPPSIVDRSFFGEIRSLIDDVDYPKDKVVIEISEELLLSHQKHAKQNIIEATEEEELNFALDDFGVGHGSFKTLKTLPLRFLKIDGTFIQNLPSNAMDQNFVGTIANLCQDIDLDVVGEWIEDEETSELLSSMGVPFHQGYFYFDPQPLSYWLKEPTEFNAPQSQ
jgi:diguanylate cyclase (GGDEF)-like protein/PAS domain S-box-containing protein